MIQVDRDRNIWVLECENTAYGMGLTPEGALAHIYFGEKLPYLSDYPDPISEARYPFTFGNDIYAEEYPAWSGAKYSEPCLKLTYHDQVRDAVLKYHRYTIEQDRLVLYLKDSYYPLEVKLTYSLTTHCDMIERTAEIMNKGDREIILEEALTGATYLPKDKNYRLTYLTGKWAGETQIDQVMLPDTKTILESRRGTTSHFANPFYALDKNGQATEDSGEIYFGALAYSGNWKIVIEKDKFNLVKISAGIQDFDFCWVLKPGANFVTPKFILGYSSSGFGSVSRNMHRYQLQYVLPEPGRNQIRKVLYNSWEATYFDVNEEQQGKLAEIAAGIGVELFVMDDGWFGRRNHDRAGLGDWYVNPEKFPQGLKGLIDKVNSLGMDFGLWVEPEMVNPDSNLYRAHPEWVYHFQTRENTEIRQQLILNLAREDVRRYIYGFLDKLLSENNIRFIKWDMNRNFSEPGFPSAPAGEQREIWVRHIRGVYEIVSELRRKHPQVLFQSCSGGGGRVDLGILQYFDQVWTSDNTDAFDRLFIQEGFSYPYCAKIMEAWVTSELNWVNHRNLSLKYRFHSAMMGNLGIGDNLFDWTSAEKDEARQFIGLYKEIRDIVQHGRQYRLLSPKACRLAALMYVNESQTEAVLFAFLHANHFGDELPRIYLKGLKEDVLYELEGKNLALSGKALMKLGIRLEFGGDFDSEVIRIRVKEEPNS